VSRKKKRDRVDGYAPADAPSKDPWRDPAIVEQIEKRARMDADNLDGFRNELTGIGHYLRDKTMGGRSGPMLFDVPTLTYRECGDRWRGSDLGSRIVETVPDEMTREGWEVVIQPDEDEQEDERADAFGAPGKPAAGGIQPDLASTLPKPRVPLDEPDDESAEIAEEVDGILEELCASDRLWEALCYERGFGGGAVLIGADDGMEDLSQPLDEDSITEVRHLTSFRGGWDGELVAWSYYRDPTEPKFGEPEIYMLRNTAIPSLPAPGGTGNQKAYDPGLKWIHESRLLVFSSTSPSREVKTQLRGWGDSIFTRVDEVLSHYGQTWGGIANLMTDFSQSILKIKDLAQSMAANNRAGTKNLTNRSLALNMARSISRILLIDSEEEFSRDTVSLSGVAEVLQQFALRLAAAADMPVSLLMGQAPAGLNATGASDIRFFYDRIASRQRKRLGPQLKRLVRLILKSDKGPTKGKEPERWNIKFRSLYQMTELEKAQVRKTVAETDAIYITNQVLTPEEVAASAYGGSEWSMERTIDFKGREVMAQQEAENQEAMAAHHEEMKAAQLEAMKGKQEAPKK
jgi:phage-related protein (TIGR01555 family)